MTKQTKVTAFAPDSKKMHLGSQSQDLSLALRNCEGEGRGIRAEPKFILSNRKLMGLRRSRRGRGFQERKGHFRSGALAFDMPNLNICVFKVLFKAATFVYLLHQTGATALIDTANGNPSVCGPVAPGKAAARICPQSLPQTRDTDMALFEETK